MRKILILMIQATFLLISISCGPDQKAESNINDENRILDVQVEAEIEDGELVLYASVRNMLNEPILMRTRPEEALSISYDINYGNENKCRRSCLGSAWSTLSDTKFIALNGQGGFQSRDFADDYLFRIPVVKQDFGKVKEIKVDIGWWSDYFETESGLEGDLNVDMEMIVIPTEKCRVIMVEEKIEKEHMKKVPEIAEDKTVPRPYKYDLYKGKENKPFLDKITSYRKYAKLYVSVDIVNPTRDVMLWQVEPCPVKILKDNGGPRTTHVLPVKLSPLADYEYGFRAVGWEVSSVWHKDILIRWTSKDMKELDVYIRGYYYNATKAKWGVLTEKQTVKLDSTELKDQSEEAPEDK